MSKPRHDPDEYTAQQLRLAATRHGIQSHRPQNDLKVTQELPAMPEPNMTETETDE
jgi:hypothetical protein